MLRKRDILGKEIETRAFAHGRSWVLPQTKDKRVPATANQPKRQSGRPRSETSRLAVIAATMSLLDGHSVRDLTVDAIAREAGVSKATIYRWWPTKTRLVIDAFMETMAPRTPMPKPGAGLPDLASHVASVVREYQGKFGRIVAEIIAEGQFDPDTFNYFRETLISKRRIFAQTIVNNAKVRGEIRSDIDTDVLIDMLYGPIYYRLLVGNAPLTAAFANELAQMVAAMSVQNTAAKK